MKLCPPDRPNWTLGGFGGVRGRSELILGGFGGVKGSGGWSVEKVANNKVEPPTLSRASRSQLVVMYLDHMLHCLVSVAERAFIGRMHSEIMKLVEGWKYIVAYFCEKNITIYPVDGK